MLIDKVRFGYLQLFIIFAEKYKHMNMKRFLSAITLLVMSHLAWSQSPNILDPDYQNSRPNPWTYGGNIGIGYSTYGLGIDVSPRLGYKITEDLELAAVVNGSFQNSEYYRSLLVGVGPALTYYIGRVAYVSSSYQHYFISQKHKNTDYKYNTEEDALYVGAGYMQNVGGNVYIQIGVSYNVLYKKDKSVFSSGFIPSVGIVIGL